MAWNEPGGKPPNDPWRSGNDKGPPDLDEFFKKMQNKFRGGGGNGGSSSFNAGPIIVIALIVGIVLLIGSGIYTVEQAERAVVLRFGKFHTEQTAGLHWRIPLVDQVLKVDVQEVQGYDHQALMISEDQNIVNVSVNIQYRVDEARDYFLKIVNPISGLEQATSSALRHVVGGESMDSVITSGRQKVATDVKARLQEYLDDYQSGLYVTKVSIADTQPPKPVKEAFDDVIRAKEDKVRLQNEARAYANQVVPEARGRSARLIAESEAYKGEVIAEATGNTQRFNQLLSEYTKAPLVTRERLYLETMETVYGETPKVYISADSANNMMYLPMDQILKNAKNGKSTSKNSQSTQQQLSNGLPPLESFTPKISRTNQTQREGR